MFNVHTMLATAIKAQASDVHINVGMQPIIRRDTQLLEMEAFPIVANNDAKEMCFR